MNRYDVIVIGLGGMGSAAAYQLAKRGEKVLGIERFHKAHNQGSSHGKTRVIRQAYYEDPAYVPLLLRAYELWREIEHESGQELLFVTGGLMMGAPESEVVSGSIRSAQEYGLEHEILDADDIHRRYPPFTPPPSTIALYEKMAGFLRVEASVAAYCDRAAELGADLHFEEPVRSWEASDTDVTVSTDSGDYIADSLAICPGAWAPDLLVDMGLPLEVERQILFWFDAVGGVEPFALGKFPIYMWECDNGRLFYGFPSVDGPHGGVKVAFHYKGIACTPDTIDRTVHQEEIESMRAQLAGRLPALHSTCLETATCMYTNTPDKHFVIARHPQHERVTVACGFSGHGYKFASVVGEVVADLVIDGATRHSIDLFRPQRLV